MNFKNIIKNLSYTFSANIISLTISMIVTLVLPKLIGEDDFGYWQLYLFYVSYAGVLHIGICDGIYLRYGGYTYEEIDKIKLKSQLYYLLGFISIISLIGVVYIVFFHVSHNDKIIIYTVLIGSILHVIKTFFLLILQTTNRLKEYSIITIVDRLMFITSLVLIISFFNRDFVYLICADIFGKLISLIFALHYCKDIILSKKEEANSSIKELVLNLKAGIPLLVAGLASNFIIGCIRIGIENGWEISVFGKVSLSLSVTNMFLSFVTMVGIVFFPIIKTLDEKKHRSFFKICETIIIALSLSVLIFSIPIQNLIKLWIPNYYYAMQVMVVIIPICVFECENSILLNTFLKSFRKEKSILIINISVVALSIVYTFIFTSIYKNIDILVFGIVLLIGIRTLISKVYILFLLNENIFDLRYYTEFFVSILYLIIIFMFNNWVGAILNLVLYSCFILFKRSTINEYIRIIRRKM